MLSKMGLRPLLVCAALLTLAQGASAQLKVAIVNMQQAVYKTMETELKDAMLARTRDAYAFKVLDPAVARDPKDIDSPNKPLIIAVGAGFGLLIGVVLAALGRRRASVARAKSQ